MSNIYSNFDMAFLYVTVRFFFMDLSRRIAVGARLFRFDMRIRTICHKFRLDLQSRIYYTAVIASNEINVFKSIESKR